MLRGGTIVDATLITALPSTKNKERKRDPEMTSSKNGNQWYFGMKAHIGVDAKSGLVQMVGVTTGKIYHVNVMDNLIREDDTAMYGDKGYAHDANKRAAEEAGVLWAVKEKAMPGRDLSERQRARNRRFGKVRAKIQHVFRVLKCEFGNRKIRYRGIVKNGAQVFGFRARQSVFGLWETCILLRGEGSAVCRARQAVRTTKAPTLTDARCKKLRFRGPQVSRDRRIRHMVC